ncbi:MAG: hypothetical protein KUG77_03600 [Nannocystaceae bacterium]|nr:hypothetical protein [Nannocystaceae bacterium]
MRGFGCWALLLGIFACDADDGGNSATGAWMPDTDGSTTAGPAEPSADVSDTLSTHSAEETGGGATGDPTTSDPDPTAVNPSSTTGDSSTGTTGGPAPSGCTTDALTLIDLLNDYRSDSGLAPIPASNSLCTVGDLHVQDLTAEAPHTIGNCNLHSWSDAGSWSGCCYTPDHATAQCMWDKPRELTAYPGNGYENAAGGGGSLDPAEALDLWKGSPGHNAVMLNEGIWADRTWNAVGVGISGGYAVLWFGEESDPAS